MKRPHPCDPHRIAGFLISVQPADRWPPDPAHLNQNEYWPCWYIEWRWRDGCRRRFSDSALRPVRTEPKIQLIGPLIEVRSRGQGRRRRGRGEQVQALAI